MTTPPDPAVPPVPPVQTEPERTFTQADVDRIVQERALREVRAKYGDYDDLKTKASQFDQLAEKHKSETEKLIDAARKEGRSEVQQAANDRLLKSRIEALAAREWADPADAVRLMDASSFKVGDNGEIDDGPIKAALADTLKTKPYLAAKPTGFQGSGDGGARSNGSTARQVTPAELKTMTPAQIVKAQQEGRLANVLEGR